MEASAEAVRMPGVVVAVTAAAEREQAATTMVQAELSRAAEARGEAVREVMGMAAAGRAAASIHSHT